MEDPRIIAERVTANVERVIIGKDREVRLALIALLCQGHILIEDVPGVGKTILARSIAVSTGCCCSRASPFLERWRPSTSSTGVASRTSS